ncbi:hypothetical protein SUGI_0360680 [Cryptomeria japonica]|nr:hypothetical protein SUGI_0360680 [Cryptomeria japonica]
MLSFAQGCDGSILIDSTPGNKAEKDSPANFPSLRGFEVIDEAKRIIESVCPQVVSCADIIAFAARDSSYEAGKISWYVPAGRKDGRILKEAEIINNLPPSFFNFQQLTDLFEQKGLYQEDVVFLSGNVFFHKCHSIGVSHFSSFHDRLYNFNNTGVADPSLDPQLAKSLKVKCPRAMTSDPTVPLESITPAKLDNVYYSELLRNRGLLTYDHTLITNSDTRKMVQANSRYPTLWRRKFANAMVKMGTIDVLTGSQGEIRKNYGIVNRN